MPVLLQVVATHANVVSCFISTTVSSSSSVRSDLKRNKCRYLHVGVWSSNKDFICNALQQVFLLLTSLVGKTK